MAPKVTSSSNRSKGKASKPVTKGQNPQRANRQSVSNAQVTQNGGGRRGSAPVTNSSQRTNTGSARVTGGSRASLPPGNKGGAVTKPSSNKPTAPRSNGGPVQQVRVRDMGRPQLPGQFRGWGNTSNPNSFPTDSGRPRGATAEQRAASAPKPAAASGGVRGLLPGRAPISMGGLRGGVIGAVGMAGADYVGRKAGNAIGGFLRDQSNQSRNDPRRNTPGGRTNPGRSTGKPATDGRYIPGSQQVKIDQPKPAPKPEAPATRPATQSRSSASPARMPSAVTRSSSPTGAKPKAPQSSGYSAPKPPNMDKVETTTTDAPKPPTAKDLMKAVTRRGVGRDEMIQDNLRRARKNRG
jgi:hypothetical protein